MPRIRVSPVVPHLLREQANAMQLYLQYKGYHWNVTGLLFRELHALFDEHATLVLDTVDPLAERQRMLGSPASYTLADLSVASKLAKDTDFPATTRDMLERLLTAHRVVIEGMHQGFKAAELEGDPGSADVFARFVQVHEKMEWFLREILNEAPLAPGEAGRLLLPAANAATYASIPASPTPTRAGGRQPT
jgi:starvation-inducible DNA-binding protein